MTTSNNCSVLKDVVAYVDVWSSDKTANYSKPFVQQLQDMGAQVSKTFTKHVTHVVFYNGHPATWRKAKKINVKLVSALWVGSCYDDGVHVDEELYPALDETNPLLKNKKHRCMHPKDSPERTPENDRRMRKKIDKMMKGLAPKQPLVLDVSPIIIDEENGIVYSPALKRSDYMAQRLKDMKEKHENLSPTASQMVESCSQTGLKPSLGSTPTVLKLTYDQSDEDSSASAAEPACSPDKEEERSQNDSTEHGHPERCHIKAPEKPLRSTCCDASSPLKCPNVIHKEEEKRSTPQKSRRISIKRQRAEKQKSKGINPENPCQNRSEKSQQVNKEKRQSLVKSSHSPKKTEKGKQKVIAVKTSKENKIHFFPAAVDSPQCFSSPKLPDPASEQSKQTSPSLQKMEQKQKTPKQARPSFSSLVRSFTLSGDSKNVSGSTDGDDGVFEDYFSPANCPQKSDRPLLPDLPVEGDIQIPFKLLSVPKKRKQRRESTRSATNSEKKRKREESQRGKNHDKQSDTGSEPQSHPGPDVKESLDSPRTDVTCVTKRRRQSNLPLTSTSTTSVAVKRRSTSTSVLPTMLTEDDTVLELQKNPVSVLSHTLEISNAGTGNEAAAGFTEISSEGEENHNKHDDMSLLKMADKTKTMRTLVMTSLPTEKQHIVRQVVKSLGGFSIVDSVCESTTHVVSGGQRRTLNILLGIARGCWILSYEWILWCLEQRQWVPEEPYELSDQFPAAQICRLQRHLSAGEHQQDLFQSQPAMFVSQHTQPPTQSLMELIQLCGGTVCKTVRQAGICIGKYKGRRPEGSRILSEQWVLDSITHLKQLSYDNYDLD